MRYRRLLFLFLIFVPAISVAFPEIPFCPLGGPPGWFNRFALAPYAAPSNFNRSYPVNRGYSRTNMGYPHTFFPGPSPSNQMLYMQKRPGGGRLKPYFLYEN